MVYVYNNQDSLRKSYNAIYNFPKYSISHAEGYLNYYGRRGSNKDEYKRDLCRIWLDKSLYMNVNYWIFSHYKDDATYDALYGHFEGISTKPKNYDLIRFRREEKERTKQWRNEERKLEEIGLGYKSIEDFMFDTSSGNEYENVIQDELDYQVEYCFCNGYYSDNEDINYD
jgi:hypothetical protein